MNTIEKTFFVIERVVAHQSTGLSFSDITRINDLPKSSTHRILKKLVDMEYLVFNKESRKYRGSLKLTSLGAQVIENLDIRKTAHPYLQQLHEESRHTCFLARLGVNRAVILDKIESKEYGIMFHCEVGKETPLHCTGLGKTLLAFMDPSQRVMILSKKLERYTDNTITEISKLEHELSTIRERGYAIDNEEITRGIVCVAAPIINFRKEVLASLSTAFPYFIRDDRGLKKEIKLVTKCAKRLSRIMGKKNVE